MLKKFSSSSLVGSLPNDFDDIVRSFLLYSSNILIALSVNSKLSNLIDP